MLNSIETGSPAPSGAGGFPFPDSHAQHDYSNRRNGRSVDNPTQPNSAPSDVITEGVSRLADVQLHQECIIGAILLEPSEAFDLINESGFDQELFLDRDLKYLFEKLKAYHDEGNGIDIATAYGLVSPDSRLKRKFSSRMLGDMMERVPSVGNLPSYIEQIAEAGQKKSLLESVEKLQRDLKNGALPVDEILQEFIEVLNKKSSARGVHPKRAFEVMTPSQLAEYEPDKSACLIGDTHITKGAFSIFAGHGGVGKSRLALWMAVCGATCKPWMGLTVHRQFKTYILQAENGATRLSKEFKALIAKYPDTDFDEFIKITPPPAEGMLINDRDFVRTLKADIKGFKPDVVIVDPWTELASDGTQRDYAEVYRSLRRIVPSGEGNPALVVIAHCRKPDSKSKSRPRGRQLMHEIAGSYSLPSKARSAFVLEAGSDSVESEDVVFTVAKLNDADMTSPSAWAREQVGFTENHEFDWEAYHEGASERENKRSVSDDLALEILEETNEGGPASFSEWHEGCKTKGVYKSKSSFTNCIERLQAGGQVTKQPGKRGFYLPVFAEGAFLDA